MNCNLTDEQRRALIDNDGDRVLVHDPVSGNDFVLLPATEYQKLIALSALGDFDIRDTYAAQEQALSNAGWNDPALDAYSDLNRPADKCE